MIPGIGSVGVVKKISLDGKFQIFLNGMGNVVKNSLDRGINWLSRSQVVQFALDVCISGDGVYQACADYQSGVLISSNSGVSFSNKSSGSCRSVSMSGSGQYVIAGFDSGAVRTSTDYGAYFTTWVTESYMIRDVGMSFDGSRKFYAVNYNNGYIYIYRSISYQNYYSSTGISNTGSNGTKLVVSGSGQYVIHIHTNAPSGDYLFLSTNYGVSFTTITSLGIVFAYAGDISYDGKYQLFVAGTSGRYYRSTDYGVTWSNINLGVVIDDCSVSYSGQYMAMCSSNKLWESSDYGSTWTTSTTPVGSKIAISKSS